MCGIVGYVGDRSAAPFLIDGLKRLEYRGYDSAGIAVYDGEKTEVVKREGRLSRLEESLNGNFTKGFLGIGHTRWATHGKPSDINAHPHTDCSGNIIVVHNGIIENYQEIREWLKERGHRFRTEVDTEVIPHLIEEYYQGDLVSAVQKTLEWIRGSFALGILSGEEPDKIIAVRKDSPLVVGLGNGENYIASDIPAILEHTRKVYILKDGHMAVVKKDRVDLMDFKGRKVEQEVFDVKWDAVAAEKSGYPHFMLKEIHEQPRALKDTMTGRIDPERGDIRLDEITIKAEDLENIDKIFIVACGTAYHAGIVGKHAIERLTRIPVEVDIASEFRYRDPMVDDRTIVIIISQSGETADTLAALRESKKRGARIIAITNVVGSSVSREAEDVLYTWAGPEIAVASTKAYSTQLVSLYMLALKMALEKGTVDREEAVEIMREMKQLPEKAQRIIGGEQKIKELAYQYSKWDDVFFIGRGLDYAVALEGSLKLKEISYIHAEAYPAGELKHGTLALITEGIPVISLVTQEQLYEKTLSNIKEVEAREATVIAVAMEGDENIAKNANHVIYIPRTIPFLTPVLTVIPLQLFAYYAAVARGCDVDKPRNLAKSVTVE
ncbi:Glutamine--fructose-6-phosphate aminotransferase [isomerizing] [Koleobacter methoxysyntrophicus]|uniref:Glutamine--fructose-6-phosphate aminotransferase [isomerizing] n=1 Tax=Koleobacter methoxysyntrophicus TaxID=2751313 RepID=A0A8A0RKN1_9FIRM|nr:glutamine--fructose-6-phosphate transaminase (isomerizing) [Koleobacter methoxysyntrophicus]QSQ08274.1 Glutamine--fructose-6-phosphate aminotransferase [isomerizing] [Koleobacter methoxysyntrophicus]